MSSISPLTQDRRAVWVAAGGLGCCGRFGHGLWQIEPRYMLTGGVIGAFITYTVIKSFDALGPAKSALLIVVAQILVAYLIEVFGWFGVEKAGFEWRKAIGAAHG